MSTRPEIVRTFNEKLLEPATREDFSIEMKSLMMIIESTYCGKQFMHNLRIAFAQDRAKVPVGERIKFNLFHPGPALPLVDQLNQFASENTRMTK